jgi:hypothetical protein
VLAKDYRGVPQLGFSEMKAQATITAAYVGSGWPVCSATM